MTKLGMEFGVEGMLTTIWGDLGNIAPLELSDFSMSFGVAKSWNSDITIDELPKGTDKFIYRAEGMSQYLKELSELHKKIGWYNFTHIYSNKYHEGELPLGQLPTKEDVLEKQKAAEDFRERLSKEKYENEHKKEMLIQAEGIQLVAELTALHTRIEVERRVDANEWLKKFREAWLSKNKESELKEVEKIFITMDKGC
ncbi:MAG: hypothetical protein IKB60_01480, partial [Clostridia bacterium]|nr:hypothetical protein [Clostridia bacterium]